jgi:hypothetical protein
VLVPSEKEIKEILNCIEAAFPFVDKPKREEILPEDSEPTEANWIFSELNKHSGKELPEEAINYLYDEFPFLTPKAIRWILPSYLRYAVKRDKYYHVPEFFIYHLSLCDESSEADKEEFSFLNEAQISCLVKVFEFWQRLEEWDTLEDDIRKAIEFLRALKPSAGPEEEIPLQSDNELEEINVCIESAFPFVDRPKREEILQEDTAREEVDYILAPLDKCPGKELSEEAIDFLYDKYPFLTAKAIQWILPSYLRSAMKRDYEYDQVPEFLIYTLSGGRDDRFADIKREQFAFLNEAQIACLLKVLEYWQSLKEWSTCADFLQEAIDFVRSLKPTQTGND